MLVSQIAQVSMPFAVAGDCTDLVVLKAESCQQATQLVGVVLRPLCAQVVYFVGPPSPFLPVL